MRGRQPVDLHQHFFLFFSALVGDIIHGVETYLGEIRPQEEVGQDEERQEGTREKAGAEEGP